MSLSDKMIKGNTLIPTIYVKEFIKELKEEIGILEFPRILRIIDKKAGDKLI